MRLVGRVFQAPKGRKIHSVFQKQKEASVSGMRDSDAPSDDREAC